MHYAIIGDIHSSTEDLQAVLAAIQLQASGAQIIGTGDIFECTISKKDLHGQIYSSTKEVLLSPPGFQKYLTFPTVYGNQEERIVSLTENEDAIRTLIRSYPERIEIEGADIIHGHQWEWGGPRGNSKKIPRLLVSLFMDIAINRI